MMVMMMKIMTMTEMTKQTFNPSSFSSPSSPPELRPDRSQPTLVVTLLQKNRARTHETSLETKAEQFEVMLSCNRHAHNTTTAARQPLFELLSTDWSSDKRGSNFGLPTDHQTTNIRTSVYQLIIRPRLSEFLSTNSHSTLC